MTTAKTGVTHELPLNVGIVKSNQPWTVEL